MSDETQQSPKPPTGRLTFTDADGPVHRTVMLAFLQSYNSYRHITCDSGLEIVLADLTMRARALRQIGEVDDTYVEQFENMVRAFDEAMTNVGRMAAATLDFMAQKRGGTSDALEEWPSNISDEEM